MFLRPPKLVRVLGLPLICLAMFSIAGGHWAILQTVAWGQMLWSYSKSSGSMVDGAKKTFSGQYPCAMCKKVAEARDKEQKAPATFKTDKKAESFLLSACEHFDRPPGRDFSYPSHPDWTAGARRDRPPCPIPILFA